MNAAETAGETSGVRLRVGANILVVDDDDDASELLQTILECHGYKVATASSGSRALAQLKAGSFDLVLSDVSMAQGDGLELVSNVRKLGFFDLPVILMSAEHDTRQRVVGLDIGADDFLPKPIELDDLLARLRVQLRRAQRQGELLRQSLRDPLTHLLNRRGLSELFSSHAALLRRRPGVLSLLMLDVDDFKRINDQYGHGAGDSVLVGLSQALVGAVRASDRVGRMGGDEFAILMPEAKQEVAYALVERLAALSPLTIQLGPALSISVGFSVGAATASVEEPLALLLARADAAMYNDKRGRASRAS